MLYMLLQHPVVGCVLIYMPVCCVVQKHCNAQKALLKQRYKPSLFQHVGLHSSLPGKLQHLKVSAPLLSVSGEHLAALFGKSESYTSSSNEKSSRQWLVIKRYCTVYVSVCVIVFPLQDKDFGKQALYKAHNNPVAELSSSLKHYQGHSLERAYKGEDFFWALTPIQGDYILLKFPDPIHISRSDWTFWQQADSANHFLRLSTRFGWRWTIWFNVDPVIQGKHKKSCESPVTVHLYLFALFKNIYISVRECIHGGDRWATQLFTSLFIYIGIGIVYVQIPAPIFKNTMLTAQSHGLDRTGKLKHRHRPTYQIICSFTLCVWKLHQKVGNYNCWCTWCSVRGNS